MRRRRRRNSFSPRRTNLRFALLGVGALAVIGAFVFFMRQADVLAPEPREISMDAQSATPAQP